MPRPVVVVVVEVVGVRGGSGLGERVVQPVVVGVGDGEVLRVVLDGHRVRIHRGRRRWWRRWRGAVGGGRGGGGGGGPVWRWSGSCASRSVKSAVGAGGAGTGDTSGATTTPPWASVV